MIDYLRCSLPVILRVFDVLLAGLGLLLLWPLLLLLFVMGLFDTGSPLFMQERVGRHKRPFVLVKFRTMRLNTVSVASHLASSSTITRLGTFLRRSKLDELPQLWSVLRGDMSLVGPRPGLFNQYELTIEREKRGVYSVRPGITGLSQVEKIDMSTPMLLATTDQKMIQTLTLVNYFKYIFQALAGKGGGDSIRSV